MFIHRSQIKRRGSDPSGPKDESLLCPPSAGGVASKKVQGRERAPLCLEKRLGPGGTRREGRRRLLCRDLDLVGPGQVPVTFDTPGLRVPVDPTVSPPLTHLTSRCPGSDR